MSFKFDYTLLNVVEAGRSVTNFKMPLLTIYRRRRSSQRRPCRWAQPRHRFWPRLWPLRQVRLLLWPASRLGAKRARSRAAPRPAAPARKRVLWPALCSRVLRPVLRPRPRNPRSRLSRPARPNLHIQPARRALTRPSQHQSQPPRPTRPPPSTLLRQIAPSYLNYETQALFSVPLPRR